MILFRYTLLFFVLSISMAAPISYYPGRSPRDLIFYANSHNWDKSVRVVSCSIQGQIVDKPLSQSNNVLPVIIIMLANPVEVEVVEMAPEMEYLDDMLGQKIRAEDYFLKGTRVLSESCYCES